MLFGLTNAPITSMNPIDERFKPYLDKFVVVFIHDILIYSKNRDKDISHLRIVIQTLREHDLYGN